VLIVFDEVYGFLPPHPANPPTKRPLVALMKQARAFGVGIVVATQNPMDLDYHALSNAGLWCVGRLQTDADRTRGLDGLAASMNGPDDSIRRADSGAGPILRCARRPVSAGLLAEAAGVAAGAVRPAAAGWSEDPAPAAGCPR
jgi:hypothetical protein